METDPDVTVFLERFAGLEKAFNKPAKDWELEEWRFIAITLLAIGWERQKPKPRGRPRKAAIPPAPVGRPADLSLSERRALLEDVRTMRVELRRLNKRPVTDIEAIKELVKGFNPGMREGLRNKLAKNVAKRHSESKRLVLEHDLEQGRRFAFNGTKLKKTR